MCVSTADKRFYTKFLIIPFLFLLAIPNNLAAAEVRDTYEEYQQTVIYRPACDPIKGIATEEDCFYKAPKKSSVATYQTQCVWYAKTLTGVYGTWGNGGRYLSSNSGPVVGAVIIFNYVHVGVITYFDGYNIGYTDRNFDRRGTIRGLVWTTITDSSIWKYHVF